MLKNPDIIHSKQGTSGPLQIILRQRPDVRVMLSPRRRIYLEESLESFSTRLIKLKKNLAMIDKTFRKLRHESCKPPGLEQLITKIKQTQYNIRASQQSFDSYPRQCCKSYILASLAIAANNMAFVKARCEDQRLKEIVKSSEFTEVQSLLPKPSEGADLTEAVDIDRLYRKRARSLN